MGKNIGRGIDFPLHFEPQTGGVAYQKTADNVERIKQAIKILITTNLGERFFRPSLGTVIKRALFDPLDGANEAFIQFEIERAVIQNEPRAEFREVTITADDQTQTFSVSVVFNVRGESYPQNVVIPFIVDGTTIIPLPPEHSRENQWEV